MENKVNYDYEIYADVQLLLTIIRNILSNAIKFTPQNSKITIIAEKLDDFVKLSITDTGIGIPPEIIDKLFIISEKTARPGTNGEKSTGLGLILSKEYIELNGGNIFIESTEGIGTTVSFTVPLFNGEDEDKQDSEL